MATTIRDFLGELKRRRVHRAAATYTALSLIAGRCLIEEPGEEIALS